MMRMLSPLLSQLYTVVKLYLIIRPEKFLSTTVQCASGKPGMSITELQNMYQTCFLKSNAFKSSNLEIKLVLQFEKSKVKEIRN